MHAHISKYGSIDWVILVWLKFASKVHPRPRCLFTVSFLSYAIVVSYACLVSDESVTSMSLFNFTSPLLHQLSSRLAVQPKHPTHEPSAVLIAITDEVSPKILYTVRASHMTHHAGEVAFAGGRRELGDKDNAATALREAYEETAILPEQVRIIGELPLHHAKSGMPVVPIVGVIPPNLALVPEVGEIARLFWGDLATLITQETVPYIKQYGDMLLQSPAFMVEGETVWGLTGRMTANLLKLGFDRDTDWTFNVVQQPIGGLGNPVSST